MVVLLYRYLGTLHSTMAPDVVGTVGQLWYSGQRPNSYRRLPSNALYFADLHACQAGRRIRTAKVLLSDWVPRYVPKVAYGAPAAC